MSGKLIIFSAPSGAGKTTIVKKLLEENLNLEFSVSACSRPMRSNETNGVDYYFLTVDEFKKHIANNNFIEWEQVYENCYYGTLKSEIERIFAKGNHVVFDVDVMGGLNLKKIFKNNALAIFVMPPSLEILKQRLINRHTDSQESLQKRITKAEKEIEFATGFDKIVINDILETTIAEVKKNILAFFNTVEK